MDKEFKMNTTNIAWNGVDSYIETNESIFTRTDEFKPFSVIEINKSDIPFIDEELDLNGIFVTENGKTYIKNDI